MAYTVSPAHDLTFDEAQRHRNHRAWKGLARGARVHLTRACFAARAICAVVMLSACHSAKPTSAAPAVVVALPIQADAGELAGEAIRYPVEVAARYSNPMSFRVPGKIVERAVRIGDRVKQGQVVARLDSSDAQKQAAAAQAGLEGAATRLLFAKQQLDRDNAQAAQNLIAAKQLEQSQDAFSSARAAHDQAAEELALARNKLQYNTLTADHDGVITSENADTGQVVSAGQAIYGLAWSGETDVILDAAAGNLSRIAVGQAASVTFPTLPGRRFPARVREIASAADAQSRTYRVKLTFLQSEQAVFLGMTGEATLAPAGAPDDAGPRHPTFTVPSTAIFHEGNTPAVWVVAAHNSTLELRPVTVRTYGDHASVVSGGLRNGDTVVLAGVHTVYAGERVTAVRPMFDGEGEVAGPAANPAADPKYVSSGHVGVSP
jgi:RND family efflux transporter MFP subunit